MMSTLSRIIIAFCIIQVTITTLSFLDMFHIISLKPLAPLYAVTGYVGAQYKRIEDPLLPLLYPLFWCSVLKVYIYMGSGSKSTNHTPKVIILWCLAQQALTFSAIAFWGYWGNDLEEINWVPVLRDSVTCVLTNLGLVATMKGWRWDAGYLDFWMAKVGAWAQKDRDATIKASLENKGLESKLECGLEEKTGRVEVVKVRDGFASQRTTRTLDDTHGFIMRTGPFRLL